MICLYRCWKSRVRAR